MVYLVLYISNILLGRFNLVGLVLLIGIGKFGSIDLVWSPRYKFGLVDVLWYIGFGKLDSVNS